MLRNHRYKLAILVSLMVGVWGFQVGHAAGNFSCQATLVKIKGEPSGPLASLDLSLVQANAAGSPCNTETAGVPSTTLPSGLGSVSVVHSETTLDPDNSAKAKTHAAKVLLTVPGVPTIEAEVLSSEASAICPTGHPSDQTRGTPALSGASTVAKVIVGTTVIEPVAGSQSHNLGGLGTLYFNQQTTGGGAIVQRALHLDTNLVDITVAESTADYEGNPCTVTPPTQCNDGVDNNDPEDTLADAADPGCHTDGDANNAASYDPNDNDETDLVGGHTECSDGADNADPEDTLADRDDPGCHTDGDPNNDASYDPNDDNETNAGGAECSDGVDNDDAEDNLADRDDPDCHTDFDPDNDDSYNPDGSESCDEIPADDETKRDEREGGTDREDDLGDPDDEDCRGSERGGNSNDD